MFPHWPAGCSRGRLQAHVFEFRVKHSILMVGRSIARLKWIQTSTRCGAHPLPAICAGDITIANFTNDLDRTRALLPGNGLRQMQQMFENSGNLEDKGSSKRTGLKPVTRTDVRSWE